MPQLIRLCPMRAGVRLMQHQHQPNANQLTQLTPRGPRILPANQMPASSGYNGNPNQWGHSLHLNQATANYYLKIMRQYEFVAQQARQSPMWSLFNRLDGFVAQLQVSRDFFSEWPQRICQRIRSNAILLAQQQRNNNQPKVTNHSTSECWNGRDFSGYTKPLIPLGQVINSNHPEVAVNSGPINQIVLNLIEKLKLIAGQLQVRSTRSPHQVYAISPDSNGAQQVVVAGSALRDLPVPQSLSQTTQSGAADKRQSTPAKQMEQRGMSQQEALAAAAALASSPVNPAALVSEAADDESSSPDDSASTTGHLQQVSSSSSGEHSGVSKSSGSGDQTTGDEGEELAPGESEVNSSSAEATGDGGGNDESNETDEAADDNATSGNGNGNQETEDDDEETDVKCQTTDCADILPDHTETASRSGSGKLPFSSTNSIVTPPIMPGNNHIHPTVGETVYPISTVLDRGGSGYNTAGQDRPYPGRSTTVFDSRYTSPYHPNLQFTTKYQMPSAFDPMSPPPLSNIGNDIHQMDTFIASSSSAAVSSQPIVLLLLLMQSLLFLRIFGARR